MVGDDKNANDEREKQFAEAAARATMLHSRKKMFLPLIAANMTQSINHPRNAGRLVVFCVLFADVAPRHELSFLFCGIMLRSRSGVHRGIVFHFTRSWRSKSIEKVHKTGNLE